MEIKQHIKWALALMCGAVLCLGCEAGKDDYVTNALFPREPGALARMAVVADSMKVTDSFSYDIEQTSRMLTGRYGPAEAFCVMKFLRPPQAIIDSLVDVKLYVTVNDAWYDGNPEFGLYAVNLDWTDEEPLDPGLFYPLDESVATYTDEVDSLSQFVFTLSSDDVDTWGNYGSYLIQATDSGLAMACVSTEHSSSNPYFELVGYGADGEYDTTTVDCSMDSYYLDSGFSEDIIALSDGNSTGFKFDISFPAELPKPAALNMVTMTVDLKENLIASSDGMEVTIGRLTDSFHPDSVEYDATSRLSLTLYPDTTSYTLDITEFVYEWLNLGSDYYGLVFEPDNTTSSPDYAVLAPADSMIILYTTMPEME